MNTLYYNMTHVYIWLAVVFKKKKTNKILYEKDGLTTI